MYPMSVLFRQARLMTWPVRIWAGSVVVVVVVVRSGSIVTISHLSLGIGYEKPPPNCITNRKGVCSISFLLGRCAGKGGGPIGIAGGPVSLDPVPTGAVGRQDSALGHP